MNTRRCVDLFVTQGLRPRKANASAKHVKICQCGFFTSRTILLAATHGNIFVLRQRKSGVPAFTAGKVRVARIYARCGIAAILLINACARDTERNLLIACLSHLDLPDFSIENISTRFIPFYVNGGVK